MFHSDVAGMLQVSEIAFIKANDPDYIFYSQISLKNKKVSLKQLSIIMDTSIIHGVKLYVENI